jgi:hypothetical protein
MVNIHIVYLENTTELYNGLVSFPPRYYSYRHVNNLSQEYIRFAGFYDACYQNVSVFLIGSSSCPAKLLFLMVLKVHLAKIVVAFITVPTRYGITNYAFADRFIVVVVFSLF